MTFTAENEEVSQLGEHSVALLHVLSKVGVLTSHSDTFMLIRRLAIGEQYTCRIRYETVVNRIDPDWSTDPK